MPKKKVFNDSESDEEDSVQGDQVESEPSDDDLVGESDDDSDAAPDDVTFSQSKADALRKVKDALSTIGKEKERQKEKRRLKDDQFKQQKKQKLAELDKNRLPDDFLQDIAAVPVKPDSTTTEENTKDEEAGSDQELLLDDDVSGGDSDDDGYIPLGNSDVKAVYIKDQLKTSLTAVEKAESFRKGRLYGRKIRRQPEKMRTSLIEKKKTLCR